VVAIRILFLASFVVLGLSPCDGESKSVAADCAGCDVANPAGHLPEPVVFESLGEGDYSVRLPAKDALELLTPLLAPTSKSMLKWAQGAGIAAVVNGGYFSGHRPLSLVVVDGERLADNLSAVTRGGQTYPVLRSAFWISAGGQAHFGWVGVGADNVLRSFNRPMPYRLNHPSPLEPPQVSAGVEISPEWAIGGGPRLLRNGQVEISYNEEVFWGSGVALDDVRPRTAICITLEDDILLYVTEGVRLDALPQRLLALGCRDAMNLDGGGSSALYVGGREIFDQQRPVPVVLAVTESL